MSLLAGIAGVKHNQPAGVFDAEVEASLQLEAVEQIASIGAGMSLATNRLGRILDNVTAIEAIKPEGKSAQQLARLMVAQSLTDIDLPEDMAVEATAGLESESVNVGLEAWSTVKEYAQNIIDWIVKKWKELKAWVMKYFNKYFGDVERLKGQWDGILKSAKEKQDGFELEKNSKFEVEKGADAFCTTTEKAVTTDEMIAGIGEYKTIAEGIEAAINKLEVKALEKDDLIVDGALISVSKFKSVASIRAAGVELTKGIKGKAISGNVPASYAGKLGTMSPALLGRKAIYSTTVDGEDVLEALKNSKIGIADLEAEQKEVKKLTIDCVAADVVEKMADANIEMLDAIIQLKRGKSLDKVQAELDKASKGLESWKKDAPDADAATEEQTAFRQAVKVATEYFSTTREVAVNMPLAFCNQAKMVSSQQRAFANKCLSSLKKQ